MEDIPKVYFDEREKIGNGCKWGQAPILKLERKG
jgi:hypothetical protein